MEKLKLGKVSYLNTLPFFYYFNFPNVEIVEGVPSELAKLLKIGFLDVGIVSSVFFLQNEPNYIILPDLSISSFGETGSVLIVSKKPIEEIKTLKPSKESLTSNFLAYAILRKFLKQNVEISKKNVDAEVVIGDKALNLDRKSFFIYDVGELWYKFTGLPAVYALFTAKKPTNENFHKLYASLTLELQNSREQFFQNLEKLPLEKNLKNYLKKLNYQFREPHLESLKLLKELIKDYHLGKL
jgi:chorismate dehydratase